jgi:hypothetical protein
LSEEKVEFAKFQTPQGFVHKKQPIILEQTDRVSDIEEKKAMMPCDEEKKSDDSEGETVVSESDNISIMSIEGQKV